MVWWWYHVWFPCTFSCMVPLVPLLPSSDFKVCYGTNFLNFSTIKTKSYHAGNKGAFLQQVANWLLLLHHFVLLFLVCSFHSVQSGFGSRYCSDWRENPFDFHYCSLIFFTWIYVMYHIIIRIFCKKKCRNLLNVPA